MKLFNKKKKGEEIKTLARGGQEEVVVKATLPQGEDANAYQTIIRPHLTEKASLGGAFNKYVFRVAKEANKLAIKQGIQKLYKVQVEKVAVAHLPAKERRLGRQVGHKPGFKKAVVTLRAGDKIDLAG